MKRNWQRVTTLALGGLLVAGITLSIATAREEAAQDEGRVVPVAPENNLEDPLPGELNPETNILRQRMLQRPGMFLLPGNPADIARQTRPLSPYYIGAAVSPATDVLRSHIDLNDGVGLVVQQVMEGSPADEAGLKQYDILVAADGEELHSLEELVAKVEEHSGEQMTQITFDVIRHGQPQTVWVTPAQRPQMPHPQLGQGGGLNFGGIQPHVLGFNQMPGNVSVQIEKNGDTTRIVVERGGEKWEVDGDDPESLNALPDDLRPMVEGMLKGNGGMSFQLDGLPNMNLPVPEADKMQEMMEQRMQKLRKQLEQMEQQLESQEAQDERA